MSVGAVIEIRDGGLMRDIDSEKDSEKVFSGALSYPD